MKAMKISEGEDDEGGGDEDEDGGGVEGEKDSKGGGDESDSEDDDGGVDNEDDGGDEGDEDGEGDDDEDDGGDEDGEGDEGGLELSCSCFRVNGAECLDVAEHVSGQNQDQVEFYISARGRARPPSARRKPSRRSPAGSRPFRTVSTLGSRGRCSPEVMSHILFRVKKTLLGSLSRRTARFDLGSRVTVPPRNCCFQEGRD